MRPSQGPMNYPPSTWPHLLKVPPPPIIATLRTKLPAPLTLQGQTTWKYIADSVDIELSDTDSPIYNMDALHTHPAPHLQHRCPSAHHSKPPD
jgi:hypothetical protein